MVTESFSTSVRGIYLPRGEAEVWKESKCHGLCEEGGGGEEEEEEEEEREGKEHLLVLVLVLVLLVVVVIGRSVVAMRKLWKLSVSPSGRSWRQASVELESNLYLIIIIIICLCLSDGMHSLLGIYTYIYVCIH